MADFSQLKTVKKNLADYTFYNMVGEPTLVVTFSGESNKAYFNEKLRAAERLQKRRAKLSVELLKETRERDYDLFPKHVIKGFKNVVDAQGQPVPFTPENVLGFLRAIGDSEFDNLREFCSDESNFREVPDILTTAGNSPTA